jgi:hypothetical protein
VTFNAVTSIAGTTGAVTFNAVKIIVLTIAAVTFIALTFKAQHGSIDF